eukprot:3239584-Prorocentrum_lima.AAC.1
MLRESVAPKLSYLSRMTPQDRLLPTLRLVDEEFQRAVAAITEVSRDRDLQAVLALPVVKGGL